MKISTTPSSPPAIIEDRDGVDVTCRAVTDRVLVHLVKDAATIIAVAPESSGLNSAERRLLATLEAYRNGSLTPVSYEEDLADIGDEHDRHLTPIRSVLEEHGRWLVAGRAERPGAYGAETVVVLGLIGEPHAACIVRLRLDNDEAPAVRAA